jgi:hypothetical protein
VASALAALTTSEAVKAATACLSAVAVVVAGLPALIQTGLPGGIAGRQAHHPLEMAVVAAADLAASILQDTQAVAVVLELMGPWAARICLARHTAQAQQQSPSSDYPATISELAGSGAAAVGAMEPPAKAMAE